MNPTNSKRRAQLGGTLLVGSAIALMLCTTTAFACEEEPALSLNSVKVARGLEGRQPLEVGRKPVADGRTVYLHFEFNNPDSAHQAKVIVTRNGKRYYTTRLNVGVSPHWRTWVRLKGTKSMIGDYRVSLYDEEEGFELATETFQIVAPENAAITQAVAPTTALPADNAAQLRALLTLAPMPRFVRAILLEHN